MESIYIVWCPTSSTPPTKRHITFNEAQDEARRLAKLNPNKVFFICRVLQSLQYSDNPFIYKAYKK